MVNVSDNPGLRVLREKIRYATEPDNPRLIDLWFSLDKAGTDCRYALRAHFEAQFGLLLETLADELIPSHWRWLCLDNIYKPLCALQKISDDEESERQLNRLFNELSVITRYVEHSLYY